MNGRKAKALRKAARIVLDGQNADGKVIPQVAYKVIKPQNASKEYRGTRVIPVYDSYRGMYRHLKKLSKKGLF